MAPRGRRGEAAEAQAFHELGVRGRKTGVFLPDTGERDEHGMMPLEDLLSSPQKAPTPANRRYQDEDSGSEDMEIASSTGPGPRTLLKGRPSLQYPIPRSRSPLKTNLKSPARKNPHLDRLSSQARGPVTEERDPTVTRRLDFGGRYTGRTNGANGTLHEDEEEEEEEELDNVALLEESLQMVDSMMGSTPDPEPEVEDTIPPEDEEEDSVIIHKSTVKKKGRGRPPKVVVEEPFEEPFEEFVEEPSLVEEEREEELEEEAPVQRRRGRPAKKDVQKSAQALEPSQPSRKRRSLRNSSGGDEIDEEEPEPQESERQTKKPRIQEPKTSRAEVPKASKAKPAAAKPEAKPRGRPGRKAKVIESGDVGETSFAALQRGPPMPKSRGLVSVRRDPDVMTQTRSGRHSYRPLDYWRGEAAVVEEEELDNMFARDRFVLPTIKEVIRVPEELPPSKRAPRSKGRSKGKSSKPAVPEEELEEWETHPGTVAGEVVLWEPEHELHPPAEDEPVQIAEEQIAISADAVQTRDIRDATFRFAKTLTMPFMGAGIVDLPPGAEKRPKNSRKMHMVFFVHFGKVLVTVNEAQFRITAGGMWFVPRGNYYSITNDYDNPARIFFSQACEVSSQLPDQSQNSIMGY